MEPENMNMENFGEIWIYGDTRNISLFDASLNVLSGAAELSSGMASERVFVIITADAPHSSGESAENAKDEISFEGMVSEKYATEQAFLHGAGRVKIIKVRDAGYCRLTPPVVADLLADEVGKSTPSLFLFALNDLLREISARCAFILGSGMIADCLRLKYHDGEIVAVCPSNGGELMAELGFSDSSKTGFITVQPNAFRKERSDCIPLSEYEKRTEKIETGLRPGAKPRTELGAKPGTESGTDKLRLLSRRKECAQEESLETAEKVVAGGAGVGNIDGFRNLRRLAAALGAEIGATRPPVLWHWTDDDRLIGQTGKSIKPELLVTVGTSGAVQFTAGITEAETVVAVNKDPNAPIFRFADIGIVEDASIFVPLLTDKIQKISMRALADSINGSTYEAGDVQGADFGSRLMQMRKAHQITVEELALKSGRTPEFIEELERNLTTPSVGFMIKLSEIFGIDPGTFLNDDERAELSGNRAKEYTRRTSNYYYQTLTPGAENEHLRVFMVTIEANRKHKPVSYRHEGEEFVYVMDGTLELMLDGKVHKLVAGESMKYNSETPHQLKSLGSVDTRCIVTLYTP